MQLSLYLKDALFNAVYRGLAFPSPVSVYLALYTGDPTEAGTGPEVSGGSYARQLLAFTAAIDGVGSNSALVSFPTATAAWGTITHAGLFDAVSGGNLLHFGPLTTPKPIDTSDRLDFDISSIDIGFL